MSQLQVMQIGNGGGFDFDQVSSSFIIKHKQTYILVDCGFNVLNKLKAISEEDGVDYISLIDTVCITHTHEDHIANLMSLIYYRYFVLGKTTTVLAGTDSIRGQLKSYLTLCNTEFKSGQIISTDMVYVKNAHTRIDEVVISPTPTFHPGVRCTGFQFFTMNSQKSITISGDTKATFDFEQQVTKTINDTSHLTFSDAVVFHDFSTWDNISQNVHACALDIETEYSNDFKKLLTFYHDAKPFARQWV